MSRSIFSILLVVLFSSIVPVNAQLACLRVPNPQVVQGSLTLGDVQQAGRVTRDGKPSSCGSADGIALENNTALRRDAHNFANPFNESVCVRVDVDFTGCGGNQTQSAAYSSYNPAFPAQNVIGDMGFSTINRGSYLFSVGPNANFTIVVNEITANTGCPLYSFTVNYLRNCRQAGFDSGNDGKADPTVYRPSATSRWFSMDSQNGYFERQFGTVGDLVTGGSDYTGDNRSDVSVYRPSTNTWYYGTDQNSPGTNFQAVNWGVTGDRAVPGDYDGDGKNDIAIWRPSEGRFYVLRSGDGTLQAVKWGVSTDNPTTGDFDGDSKTDFAIIRPTLNGNFWWILKSNYNYGFDQVVQWGLPTDESVPADYDGDGITDIAVWRPAEGNFWVRRSSDLSLYVYKWGTNGDIPQPADYDGDLKADFAVWRPSNGRWFILQSETDTIRYLTFGLQGDQPITAPYRIN